MYYNKDLLKKVFMSFLISKAYLAAILADILDFAKRSTVLARHHADPYSARLPLTKLAKTCCVGILPGLSRFVASGNQTKIVWLQMTSNRYDSKKVKKAGQYDLVTIQICPGGSNLNN